MILLDTSVIIGAFFPPRASAPALKRVMADGYQLLLSSLVLYEWRRGPRLPGEIEALELVFPASQARDFGSAEAIRAAELYRQVKNPRRREFDIALAGCAIEWGLELWTLNPGDFRDLPGLKLFTPSAK